MVKFNNRVHHDVVEKHDYGDRGSPWEFNLRDVFRWCELVVASGCDACADNLARFASHLYLQRFRTVEDRDRLNRQYLEHFGTSLVALPSPELCVSNLRVAIGEASLQRQFRTVGTSVEVPSGRDTVVIRSLLRPLEAIARCVMMKWPCLLVGPTGSGKSTAVRTLAELCNAPLLDVSLTPATDVNELVGCFEQIDHGQDETDALHTLRLLHDDACAYMTQTDEQLLLLRKISQLYESLDNVRGSEMVSIGLKLVDLFMSGGRANQIFEQQSRNNVETAGVILNRIEATLKGGIPQDERHFRWVDGILVTAMMHGYWINLENVNLCPASVLDRLNPVMEKGGELLLTECGVQKSGGNGTSHRIVKQHPDFRIFLSMNPEYGEISRAMRNRCVEVSLIPTAETGTILDPKPANACTAVDGLDLLSSTGVQSAQLGTSMLQLHSSEVRNSQENGTEPPSTKSLREWGTLFSGLFSRGWNVRCVLMASLRLSYELDKSQARRLLPMHLPLGFAAVHSPLTKSPSLIWGWSFDPYQARLLFELRPTKAFSGWKRLPSKPTDMFPVFSFLMAPENGKSLQHDGVNNHVYLDFPDRPDWFSTLRNNLLVLYVRKSSASDLTTRTGMLGGYDDVSTQYIRFMTSVLRTRCNFSPHPPKDDNPDLRMDEKSSINYDAVLSIFLDRLTQLLREEITYRKIASMGLSSVESSTFSVIETSQCLFEGRIERSAISCPLTTIVHPFFVALDDWIYHLLSSPDCLEHFSHSLTLLMKKFLSQRDRLWTYLHESIYQSPTQSSFLGFDEGGFMVQWAWLKKSLKEFAKSIISMDAFQAIVPRKLNRRFEILVEAIDCVLFDSGDELSRATDTLWKQGGHPLVPGRAYDWEAIAQLNEASKTCALFEDELCSEILHGSNPSAFDLDALIQINHPVLFVSREEKGELLAALCMCYWASTDEVCKDSNAQIIANESQQIQAVLSKQLKQRQKAFFARLSALKIDLEITTVENLLDVDVLMNLKEGASFSSNSMDDEFVYSLLFRFAQIQVSPIAEFWCVQEEAAVVEKLSEALVTSQDPVEVVDKVIGVMPRIRSFISIALEQTLLSVADLRPYQTLVWVSSGSDVGAETMVHLLKCLLPRMMYTLSRHQWYNSFTDLAAISDKLEIPPLWISDTRASRTTSFSPLNKASAVTFLEGPPRLSQAVRAEVMFRLVGTEITSLLNIYGKSTYATIENHSTRKKQALQIVGMFSSLEVPASKPSIPHELQYLFANVVEALADFFPNDARTELLAALKDRDVLQALDEGYIRSLLARCDHPAFRESLESAVYPFASYLRVALGSTSPKESEESVALCWIYIGLLRMNLLVPRSPLDPGKKPIAKVAQLDRYLDELKGRLLATYLDCTILRGEFCVDDPTSRLIFIEAERISDKRSKQERKMVERIPTAPPFRDFFRESRQFLKTMAGPDGVPALVRLIRETGQSDREIEASRNRELNWQLTVSSFCLRTQSHFAPYEDVTLPFLNAVQNVRNGVRMLAEQHLSPNEPTDAPLTASFRSLMAFPCGNLIADTSFSVLASTSRLRSTKDTTRDLEDCNFALSLAALCRIELQKRSRLGQLTRSSVMWSHSVFQSILSAWLPGREGTVGVGESPESEEALLEQEYREQFPNHSEEFNSLLHIIEVGEESDGPQEQKSEEAGTGRQLTEAQITFLCCIHRDLFSGGVNEVDDPSRIRSFCAAYGAAYLLVRAVPSSSTVFSDEAQQMGAHIMALSLTSGVGSSHCLLPGSSDVIDFHRDANPTEVAKASRPLQMLVARTTQLLTAFPGHEVLVTLVRVADRVRKLPLSSTSVGKAMSGLEIILRKAQDWEQHASSLVKLGSPLQEVSALVTRWRKLELQNWATLLDSRESRFITRARRHWPRLYSLLLETGEEKSSPCGIPANKGLTEAPLWIWKGLGTDMRTFGWASLDHDVDERLFGVTQAMDTFLLTASLGEFRERLCFVETFATQLASMAYKEGYVDPWRAKLSRMLFSLWSYYKQFLPALTSRMLELRRPIETRLRDEVKLAKWDEQSYYALADSTEKNHRKLMKLLREYDDVLETTVSSILEKLICHGIRSSASVSDEPCNAIPPSKMIFPFAYETEDSEDITRSSQSLSVEIPHRVWADPGASGLSCDKYVSQMDHYARRMASIIGAQRLGGRTWSRVGAEHASTLCATIFERIESLRKEKTSKQMKERALVDLFKTLKKNGYQNTKWSIPDQVRHMAHLLQLPQLEFNSTILSAEGSQALEGAEMYLQRTTTEVNRLRSEVLMLGSNYMSQRETQIMLSFAEHGLLMLCQERCVISRHMVQAKSLEELLESVESLDSMPLGQTKLRETLEKFNDAYLSTTENVKQLCFLMKMAAPLVEEGTKTEAIRDMISIVDSCVSSLQGYEVSSVPELLSTADLLNAANALVILEEIKKLIRECQRRCEQTACLPLGVFTACLAEIERATNIGSQILPEGASDTAEASHMMEAASLVVRKALRAVQGLCKASTPEIHSKQNEDEDLIERAIFECHSLASKEFAVIDLEGLNEAFSTVVKHLRSIHDTDAVPKTQRDSCVSVLSDLSVFVRELLELSRKRLVDYLSFFRSTAKLNYVLVRVFRVLVSKGYCADSITDAGGDGEGDVSGMNFEDDQEGTGMGEGDGKQDVTDQLESEEQLLGLKDQDQDGDPTSEKESKQLDEEEAKQGMEMEGDFEGDMFDVPEESKEDDDRDDEKDEEEIEREMGDGTDPNEEVIDEKMWDNSDDEGDQNPAEEKFENDSGVKGEALEDELRTREDGEDTRNREDATNDDSNEAAPNEPEAMDDTDEAKHEEPEINDDSEDKYEEKASGVDVRDESNDADADNKDEDEQMQLDDSINLDEGGDTDGEQGADAMDMEEEVNEDPGDDEEASCTGAVAEDEKGDDEDSISSELDTEALGTVGHDGDKDQEGDEPVDENDSEAVDMPDVEFSGNNSAHQDVHGINANEGKDSIMEKMDEDQQCEDNKGEGDEQQSGNAEETKQQATSGGTQGEGGEAGDKGESSQGNETENRARDPIDAPNPFRSAGDATKFWHKKLRMIEGDIESNEEVDTGKDDLQENKDGTGDFEFVSKEQESSAQVLGAANEEDAAHLEERDGSDSDDEKTNQPESQEKKNDVSSRREKSKSMGSKSGAESKMITDEEERDESDDKSEVKAEEEVTETEATTLSDDEDVDAEGNRVVTDLSQLNFSETDESPVTREAMRGLVEEDTFAGISDAEAALARLRWSKIQGETQHLARRLCEKLRLVMEPLVATKLKGDYRTGKRINMKRVIGYVASGYRKDKIWLRRTKPAKRNYRVLLAVDNSESMHKSGAGEMALAAMATLAVGMSQLEIGELGVASFGEEMRLLHPFHQPFTSESGINVVQNFPFDEKRTRTALCVESALSALESQGDIGAMQLVFLISDGRIERDSRVGLRRLVREMVEKNVLLVMIIVEGDKGGVKKNDSIVHMKEVTFHNGKPKVKQFIEDYPFPYYMVLDDMQMLPEILGDALRQWFEMIAQLQGSSK